MNFKNIMLNEITQTQKEKFVWFHLYEVPKVVKFTETEDRTEVTRGQGEGEIENYCLMGTISVWDNEKILEMDSGDECTTLRMYLMPLNCILKNG